VSNTLELRGRTVIVTGASSGIGEATARALHAGSTSACVPAAPPPAEPEGTSAPRPAGPTASPADTQNPDSTVKFQEPS
jgi:NAD(P)-dependent dehydrogenase (short-subunit alcohol dehydrogenase family)